jgi:hypothetical protein
MVLTIVNYLCGTKTLRMADKKESGQNKKDSPEPPETVLDSSG